MQTIIISRPEAAVIALNEIQKLDPSARGKRLSPEVQLVTHHHQLDNLRSIFIRHMFPVESSEDDLLGLCKAFIKQQGFKKNSKFISRAEFKLQEALTVFEIDLSKAKTALDLGAAPGGWTKVLLDYGMHVTAVDPAQLDERLKDHPRLVHIKNIIQKSTFDDLAFDVLVNDMRMDMLDSCRVMLDILPVLAPNGVAVMTLKLPHSHWYKNTMKAVGLLEKGYEVLGVRQLFYNRSEVTVWGRKKYPTNHP